MMKHFMDRADGFYWRTPADARLRIILDQERLDAAPEHANQSEPWGEVMQDRYRFALLTDAAAIASVHVQSWNETYTGLIPQRVIDARANLEKRLSEWEERLRKVPVVPN